MRSMESNHKQIVILRCKLVIVGEILSRQYYFNGMLLEVEGCIAISLLSAKLENVSAPR